MMDNPLQQQGPRAARRRAAWIVVGSFALVLASLYAAGQYAAESLRATDGKVRMGMTNEEVRSLLGSPEYRAPSEDGRVSWYYDRSTWFQSAVFIVRFSPDGRVSGMDDDSFP
jgi:hypothetical protein